MLVQPQGAGELIVIIGLVTITNGGYIFSWVKEECKPSEIITNPRGTKKEIIQVCAIINLNSSK